MTFCFKWDFEFESIHQPEAGTTTTLSAMHATVMWLGTFEYVVMRRYLGGNGARFL